MVSRKAGKKNNMKEEKIIIKGQVYLVYEDGTLEFLREVKPGDDFPEKSDEFVPKVGYYDFSCLEPINRLPSGIGLYDKTSFPKEYSTGLIKVHPFQPQIVRVDNFVLNLTYQGEGRQALGPKTVLTFHGQSKKGEYWMQTASPHRDVEEVIAEVEKYSVSIDALVICNPNGYELPEKDGKIPYTYALGIVSSFLMLKKDILILDFGCEKGIKIKTGEIKKPFNF